MKRILLASSALTIALSTFGTVAGPLEGANDGLDDDTFVYWEENAQADDVLPAEAYFGNVLIDSVETDDDNQDGQKDADGTASTDPYRELSTTRSADVVLQNSGARGLVNAGHFTAGQVAEDVNLGVDETGGQTSVASEQVTDAVTNYYSTGLISTIGYANSPQAAEDLNGVTTAIAGIAPLEENPTPDLFEDQNPFQPSDPPADEFFGIVNVTTSGTLVEPDVGCTLLTDVINFDFGLDNQTGVSTPASVQIACGTGNEGDTLFRLSTVKQDPSSEGVDQTAASQYAVTMYNDAIADSESDPERQKSMTLMDVASGQPVATQTFAITNSGTAENIDLQAELDDARHGGKPIPVGATDANNPAPFILNVYL